MSKALLWTSIAAVLISSFSLAASGWVIAHERGEGEIVPARSPVVSTAHRVMEADPAAEESLAKEQPAAPTVAKAEPAPAKQDEPAAAPEPSPRADAEQLDVKRFVAASDVKDREPVAPGTSFEAGSQRVYAFVEMANRSPHDGAIRIVFEKGTTRVGLIDLDIPGDSGRWRTWGYTRGLREPGTWNVVVRDVDTGKVLARQPIEVKLAGPEPEAGPDLDSEPAPESEPMKL